MQTIHNEIHFIIGAPKTTSILYNTSKTGTVYRCQLNHNLNTMCHEIDMNFRTMNVMARPDMYLGGTIVSRPNSEQVAVCGHKWSQDLYPNRPDHQIYPSGSCFVVDLGDVHRNPVPILPMTNQQIRFSTYYYSHAMSGFSATFTQSGDHLLLGAPGFYQWRGTVLEVQNLKTAGILREKFVIHQTSKFATESYTGYAITSGYFLAGIHNSIVVSAPRDMNYKGRVYIYNLGNRGVHSEESTHMFGYLGGLQMGEYFGASLLATNINADDYSDLIVGAPFYSIKTSGDCGRVFVYLSNGNGFNKPQIIMGSETIGSRFGSSISDLGDINFDGYNDIAIGAPYENERGTVYIYLGSKFGLIGSFSQRISAKDHLSHLNLRGFGISIAGKRDVDKNFYNDLLVGAYLTNNAVLFRTKPIVNIISEIKLNKSFINAKETQCQYIDYTMKTQKRAACVGVRYCIRYGGQHVPASLNLNITFQLDSRRPENPRCFMVYKNRIQSAITRVVTITRNSTQSCFDEIVVYLKDRTLIDDIFTPIELSLNYTLIHLQQSKDTFCPKCPIIMNNQLVKNQLHFQTGCRIDEKCVSNLKISTKTQLNGLAAKPTRDAIIQEGYHKSLTLLTVVQNTGEPSYLTKVLIHTKPKLNLLKQDSRCRLPKTSNNNETKHFIECDVGNPLETQSRQQIAIHFDISVLDLKLDRIVFDIEVKSASNLTIDSRLTETVVINVVRNATIRMFGNPLESEMLYEIKSKRQSNLIRFSGFFQITKQNFSSIENVFIRLSFPSLFNRQSLIYRPYVELSSGVSVNCNRTIATLPVIPDEHNRHKRDIDGQYLANENTLNLVCNQYIDCLEMECFAGPFTGDKLSMAQFIIHSALDIETIESIFDTKYDKINFVVKSSASILDSKIDVQKDGDQEVSTSFVFKQIHLKPEPIKNWIIFLSIGTGILILILITLILLKFGFFKRTKHMDKEDNEDINVIETEINHKINCETDDTIERTSLIECNEDLAVDVNGIHKDNHQSNH
ncbi:integrin alpha-9-like [Oppia nitens]|uniref:integrin alpha-9-like n=1 Tax=Oppia nitens TaxID=1686743 RepID=UPI0023DB14A3|nr:integrin alpha-9-like [Oppia nitens]